MADTVKAPGVFYIGSPASNNILAISISIMLSQPGSGWYHVMMSACKSVMSACRDVMSACKYLMSACRDVMSACRDVMSASQCQYYVSIVSFFSV